MKKLIPILMALILLSLMASQELNAQQVRWVVGGRIGMSLYSGGGSTAGVYDYYYGYYTGGSSSGTKAGLQIGPMAEVIFSKQFAIGTEFNINTQAGTPIEWADYFKVYFDIPGSKIKPYADAGFNLFFVTGGPYFGIRAGGGANFEISRNLYIPADLQLGPVFITGSTVFYLAVTSGVRYMI